MRIGYFLAAVLIVFQASPPAKGAPRSSTPCPERFASLNGAADRASPLNGKVLSYESTEVSSLEEVLFPIYSRFKEMALTERNAEKYWKPLEAPKFLSEDEFQAIANYVDHDYKAINEYLRSAKLKRSTVKEMVQVRGDGIDRGDTRAYRKFLPRWVKSIDEVMAKSQKVPAGTALFRVTAFDDGKFIHPRGSTFLSPTYLSTTTDLGTTRKLLEKYCYQGRLSDQRNVVVLQVFYFPKENTAAVHIPSVINNPSNTLVNSSMRTENEILVERGVNFKVIDSKTLNFTSDKTSTYNKSLAFGKLGWQDKTIKVIVQVLEPVRKSH